MTSERNAVRQVVTIMAKAPRAGLVKTRLCPPLRPDEAADLSRAFLADKIDQVRSASAARAIAYAPESARAVFEALAPDFFLMPQRGADLSARVVAAFAECFGRGYQAACLVDSDTPTLPPAILAEALARLAEPGVDLVLGPSEDGGYYLVGLKVLRAELFTEMPWSTDRVLPETLERAGRIGLRHALLPTWFDVDTPGDLERLRADLARDGAGARHTRRALAAAPFASVAR